VAHDQRLLWPDTLSLAVDGYLYVTANQLHRQARFHKGRDLRRKPYVLFRIRIDAQPVLLWR
jgi:sugar lactone lactonase YvrE